MFPGFHSTTIDTPRGPLFAQVGGSGPPVLLLHGFPETHLMWRAVAPRLAERFTVVATDLPGYGASFRPQVSDDHAAHSKRAMAEDHVAAMASLGHDAFAVVGHDRGGRVAYRMALDHERAVTRLAVLDVVPTGELWARADARLAIGYWHWGFLAQPAPLPERLIAGDREAFWLGAERMGIRDFPDEVIAAYRAQLEDLSAVEAWCEDYRAGATIDRALDDAETRTISCPVRVLWGANGALPLFYDDPLELWRRLAPDVKGRAIEGGSHFLAEDQPEAVLADLLAFLSE